ncbi:MAG: RNA pseudouridine synthase, partial [Tyzzerella sp.]|nr:RNA pseudouridine synthase [Tyzzerella sp.]
GRKLSLVNIQLDTGRHHQIRVQMAHMGHPIWGDAKYNTAPMQDKRYRQIALCAYRLEFAHPVTKKRLEFQIEPEGEGFLQLSK